MCSSDLVGLPFNLTLNLTFEVRGVLAAYEGHFDVLVGIGFKLARHRLKLDVVAAHETGLSEIKLQPLGRVQVVENDKPTAEFPHL